LMNQSSSSALELVISYIMSKYFGDVPEEAKVKEREEHLVQRMNRAINYRDSIFSLTRSQNSKVEYNKYEGVYVSENNVELVVKEYNGALTITMGNLLFTAEHINDDRFLVKSEVESFYDIAEFRIGSTDAEVRIVEMNFKRNKN
uniref:hypothetical protein n=1 Tax=Fulvivirga sp. TaxID=1931237 RepID=UPI004048F253